MIEYSSEIGGVELVEAWRLQGKGSLDCMSYCQLANVNENRRTIQITSAFHPRSHAFFSSLASKMMPSC